MVPLQDNWIKQIFLNWNVPVANTCTCIDLSISAKSVCLLFCILTENSTFHARALGEQKIQHYGLQVIDTNLTQLKYGEFPEAVELDTLFRYEDEILPPTATAAKPATVNSPKHDRTPTKEVI